MNTYHIELTDTFGGEANYSWKKQWLVKAKSPLGAIRKLQRETLGHYRKDWDSGDTVRYNMTNACICAFVMHLEDSQLSSFNGLNNL